MTDDRSLERTARSWLEVGPTRAPDAAVQAALARIELTSQERVLRLPWRLPPMTTPIRIAVLVTLGALLVAGVVLLAGGSQPPTPQPTVAPSTPPPPTSTPAAVNRSSEPDTAARTASPLSGRAFGFDHPFAYQLPANSGIVVSSDPHDVVQFRVPAPGAVDSYQSGIGVRNVTGGRQDPCTNSPVEPIGPGPQALVDYLRSVPTVHVSATEPVTVDGKPALRFMMTTEGPTADCTDLHLWSGPAVYTQNLGWRIPAEDTVLDVGDDHVVIQVFGDDPAWLGIGRELIGSIDFDE